MIYPYSIELQEAAKTFPNGNFGLWFYKFVPLDERNDFKAGTARSGERNVASFYQGRYDLLKSGAELRKMLEKRHKDQQYFCRLHEDNGAKVIEIRAELRTPLVTGIGKTHPNEVGMTFDHTMGIPYLPATGIKGVVRLGHILNLLADRGKADILVQGDRLDDTHPDSLIPDIFGGDTQIGVGSAKCRGNAIFLDAYPEKIPDLHVDIMNPHYGDYYSDDSAQVPPADYLNPVPIQFLTIKAGEVIVFRAIVKDKADLPEHLLEAYHTALTRLGFGAKTAIGYGRFHIQESNGAPVIKERQEKQTAEAKPTAERKVWEGATLTFTPGNMLITATSSMGKATVTGKSLVPEVYHTKLFGKKKRATSKRVVVEAVGNAWRIVEIA